MEKDSMTLERYKNYQRVIGDGDSDYIRFIHTILASCSLPIRRNSKEVGVAPRKLKGNPKGNLDAHQDLNYQQSNQ
jgi:hypothetical protein